MTKKSESAAPPRELPTEWEHYQLYKDVHEAIACLPIYFRTETHISGIMATDLQTLNNMLGATIEEQVVRTLNLLRTTWDPDEKYALYSFVRQAQTFPDVLCVRHPVTRSSWASSSKDGTCSRRKGNRAYGFKPPPPRVPSKI